MGPNNDAATTKWSKLTPKAVTHPQDNKKMLLSKKQIEDFRRDGVLVVENVLTVLELQEARLGLTATLARHGIHTDNLQETGHLLTKLSSTNGSGGVLDCFYEEWNLLRLASHPTLFQITTQLWEAVYNCNEDQCTENDSDGIGWHPYGPFSPQQGFVYIDRIGYRLPTALSEDLGLRLRQREGTAASSIGKKKKKAMAIQRSLTPHFDCCPETYWENDIKWRPIQSFISLTDSAEPNMGGFEAAKGFHQEFHAWAKNGNNQKHKAAQQDEQQHQAPPPCFGQYAHVRPRQDAGILERVRHVPVMAGSAVFWDNRIPHANAYRHEGKTPRAVVYCSFLPNIALNRRFVQKQLHQHFRQGRNPTDQWVRATTISSPDTGQTTEQEEQDQESIEQQQQQLQKEFNANLEAKMNLFQKRLFGIEEW